MSFSQAGKPRKKYNIVLKPDSTLIDPVDEFEVNNEAGTSNDHGNAIAISELT